MIDVIGTLETTQANAIVTVIALLTAANATVHIKKSNIKHIFCAGSKSYEIYNKYLYKKVKIKAIKLPSTSGANAKFSLEDLIEEYKIIKEVLNQKN